MAEELEERYLDYIAKQKNISMLKAANLINQCIKETAAQTGRDEKEIHKHLFTEQALGKCLVKEKACDQLTVDECLESCKCAYIEPYGCVSRQIPDAHIINVDPDKYIKARLGRTEDLERMVKIASYLYYNFDGGGLSDNAFDALEYYLRKKKALKERAFEKIGAPPVDKIRTTLPYPMPSLNKVKPGTKELGNFLYGKEPILWSHKLDGVSGMVVYENGKISGIYTRGDGEIGGDVTYLKDYITSIPQKGKIGSFAVRGEFIMSKDIWNQKYASSWSNARSFVSGKINSGHISPSLVDIEFVAYRIVIVKGADTSPLPNLGFKSLHSMGFKVVKYGEFSPNPTAFSVIDRYRKERESSPYFIDGLVLLKNVSVAISDISNPSYAIAFKMLLEEQIRDTVVTTVDWNITRYGRYFPVAVYESVYVDGIRLHRASAQNARHVQDWNMGAGTKIKVARSGDVIPQIKDVEVDKKIVPIFPPGTSGYPYEWHWEGADIVLNDIEGNREVQIKRIVHFFETIGVARLRQATAEKLWNAGYKSSEKIVHASKDNFLSIKGIGQKLANFYYDEIRSVMRKTAPDRFLEASTTFKSGIGRKLMKQLLREIPTIFQMGKDELAHTFKKTKIKGFGPARIKSVVEGIPKFVDYMKSFASEDFDIAVKNFIKRSKELKHNPKIKGKKFVLTEFMGRVDYEFEDYIYENQGDFVDSVTSDVTAVITANLLTVSKKMVAASDLGVPVLSIEEFSQRFDVPLDRFKKDEDEEEEN